MTTTTNILDGIAADALAFSQARSRYDKAFRMLRMTTPAVEPEHFWPMADAFRLTILRTMNYRAEGVSEAAADELQAILALAQRLLRTGETRIVFTSRTPNRACNCSSN
jgi:hypothetical protein